MGFPVVSTLAEGNPPLSARYSNYRTSYLYHATCHTFAFFPLTFSIRSVFIWTEIGMGKVPKVTLMIQCKVDGIWKKLPAPMSANGRPKNVLGATFYLRYMRNCWEPVGKDPDAAMAAKRRREIALEGVPGVFLGGADESGTQVGNRLKTDYAIEQYLTDTRAQKEDFAREKASS